MSAAATSGSSGLKLGAEPRKLAILGALVAIAVVVLIYNSNSSTPAPSNAGTSAPAANTARPAATTPHQRARSRTSQRSNDRRTLRMQEVTVEAQQGSIDPTLRLDLLERLKHVKLNGAARSLFEPGPAELPPQLAKKVTVMPGPRPEQTPAAGAGPDVSAGPAQK